MATAETYSTTARVLALTHYCGVTPRLFEALLRRFQTLDGIYAAERTPLLEIDGLGRRQAEKIEQASERLAEAEAMCQSLAGRDVRLMTRFDADYGRLLFEVHDPPALLYVRGKPIDRTRRVVAVGGTRSAGAKGIELTSRLVKELVRNDIQIVSSLVGGIDMAAHLAARAAAGSSYAVLDCGIDQVGQREGVPVAIDIVRSGGVMTEYAPDKKADHKSIAESNRLIAGLAQAVVVIEVYSDSERTLDLLRACRDIGKLVFLLVDSTYGALADEISLEQAHECGAVPIEGFERVDDIIKSLV